MESWILRLMSLALMLTDEGLLENLILVGSTENCLFLALVSESKTVIPRCMNREVNLLSDELKSFLGIRFL